MPLIVKWSVVEIIITLYKRSLFIKRQSRRCHNDRVVESSRNGTMSAINGTLSFIRQFVLYNRPPDAASITRHATRQFARAEAGSLPTNQQLDEPFIRSCCHGGHGNKYDSLRHFRVVAPRCD